MGFSKDFLWGTATAAYQIEGAVNEDGRTNSIWDDFSHTKGKILDGSNGDIACDHYHRWQQDVDMLAELGVNTYRFSVSWTRIMPDGTGAVNQKGIDFYNKLIDGLLKKGIQPFMTIFHWDYPSVLEAKGGWLNDKSSDWFLEYAKAVVSSFGDRVKLISTFNEPTCFVPNGYETGTHAPGKKLSNEDLVRLSHNILLAHGKTVLMIRELFDDIKVGVAPNCVPPIPVTEDENTLSEMSNALFACSVDNFVSATAWWSDPMMLGKYPETTFNRYRHCLPVNVEDDLKIINQPLDFYGQNIYQGWNFVANGKEHIVVPHKDGSARVLFPGWSVTPKALYWASVLLYDRYKTPIIITENGMSCHDWQSLDGKVHDPNRIDFLHRYLLELRKAADEGVPIIGYTLWSLMDNFEWPEGYTQRFGIVYVDYESGERIKKDSYYWYKDVIKNNGENL